MGKSIKIGLFCQFAGQFQNPLILLLFVSAAISVLLGQIEDAVSISIVTLKIFIFIYRAI